MDIRHINVTSQPLQEPPQGTLVIENQSNLEQTYNFQRAILLENIENSVFTFTEKLIKLTCVRCKNIKILFCDSLIGTVEIFSSEDISLLVTNQIPLITIELSENVVLYSKSDLNILNSFSKEIYICWNNIHSKKIKLPIILFSNHWLWHAAYNKNWTEWHREEKQFLIQDNVLHGVF